MGNSGIPGTSAVSFREKLTARKRARQARAKTRPGESNTSGNVRRALASPRCGGFHRGISAREAEVFDFVSFERSVPEALEAVGAAALLAKQKRIIVKPNLLNESPPPTTTPVECVLAVVRYCESCAPAAEIVVAEGSGGCPTPRAFRVHGYDRLERETRAKLVDLDEGPFRELRDPRARVWKKVVLPESVLEGFLVSVPVLKEHSLERVTLATKNLIGILPAEHYGGYWSYRKSAVHRDDCARAIADIARYRPVDLALIDASVGQINCHMSGPPCDPPVGKLVAGLDALECDKLGAELLGHDWRRVEHLRIMDAGRKEGA